MEQAGYHYHFLLNTFPRKRRDSSQAHDSRPGVGKERPSRPDWLEMHTASAPLYRECFSAIFQSKVGDCCPGLTITRGIHPYEET